MIRVLIVDDSVVFRKILKEALEKQPGITVVGTAVNGKDAIRKMRQLRPDLAVLDVEMPEMNGLQTLDEIRRQRLNVGAIMFSTLTAQGASTTLEALQKGAFDFVPKPTGTGAFVESVKRIQEELIPKIQAYSSNGNGHGRPAGLRTPAGGKRPVANRAGQNLRTTGTPGQAGAKRGPSTSRISPVAVKLAPEAVAIGVSTGGPNALNEVIPRFPANFRLPVFLVQHMPPVFTTQLAARLDQKSKLKVVEARDGEEVKGGTVYIAPGDYHMTVKVRDRRKFISLNQDPPENSCRPAVDVLFRSVAQVYGPRVVAVVMTGMGQDGFKGAQVLKKKGARIIAQDRETSVVWGMPRFVSDAGLADRVCPLDRITTTILELAGHR
jgi:two-component system chemotaxis response regulator CheB